MRRAEMTVLCRVLGMAAAGAVCVMASPVSADFTICNDTPDSVGIAIGYGTPDGPTSEGWWNLGGGACQTILRGDLTGQGYYLHAVDYHMGRVWGGDTHMCTSPQEFLITGTHACAGRGFERTGFRRIDTGTARNWTERLTPGTATAN